MMFTSYVRRADYEEAPPQDRFIVTLLRKGIQEVFSNYAKPEKVSPRALDVGCGSQPFRRDLEALGYSYISLDAEQNLEETVDIVCLIDQPLSLKTIEYGEFDFILCTEVMEHVANWEAAFSNLTKLLSPGGRLFITCPHIYQLHEEPHDYWRPTPYAFQYFADRYNLKIIYQAMEGDAWDVLGTVLANFQTEPVNQGLVHRIANKFVSKGQKILLKLLLNGYLQRILIAKGALYQANLIVFEK